MSTKVKDVMIQNVKIADSDDTVFKVANIMNRHEIGSIIISKKGKAVGIVTERDILKRVVSKNKDPSKTKIHEVMSSPLVTIEPTTTVIQAAQKMVKQKVKKLVVTNSGKLVGILSLTDLLPILKTQKVNQISLKDAPKRMKKVFEIYFDPVRLIRKNCPLSMGGGMPVSCSGQKCMWFDNDRCIFMNLISRIGSKETN
jgi:CBS domain-containing protein